MRYLRIVSAIMVVAGMVGLIGGAAGALSPVWTLGGLLLLWAGLVKVAVVEIWRRVVSHPPEHAP